MPPSRGDFAAAADLHTQAIDIGGLSGADLAAVLTGNRASVYYAKFDFDRAIEDYSQAIRLKPDSAQAYNWGCLSRAG